ncbi:MAG: hypothetical protein ACOH5I_02575 [Oligoflexus sp.]
MAKTDSIVTGRSAGNYEGKSASEIRKSMAATRESLHENIATMETLMGNQIRGAVQDASTRVKETTDHISSKVQETAEHVGQSLKAPIKELQQKVEIVPVKVQNDPLKTLAIAAGSGLLFGAWLGRRATKRTRLLRQELLSILPELSEMQTQQQIGPSKTGVTGILAGLVSTLALQAGRQLIHTGIERFQERRSGRRHFAADEAEVRLKRHGKTASM